MPPPAWPSTRSSAICFCRRSCICCACFIICWMFISRSPRRRESRAVNTSSMACTALSAMRALLELVLRGRRPASAAGAAAASPPSTSSSVTGRPATLGRGLLEPRAVLLDLRHRGAAGSTGTRTAERRRRRTRCAGPARPPSRSSTRLPALIRSSSRSFGIATRHAAAARRWHRGHRVVAAGAATGRRGPGARRRGRFRRGAAHGRRPRPLDAAAGGAADRERSPREARLAARAGPPPAAPPLLRDGLLEAATLRGGRRRPAAAAGACGDGPRRAGPARRRPAPPSR